ncbi:ATP-grasp domain-containing protein [Streptomyces gilvosporeus]|uniref:ATP-grasp domain-containing protein n=1 Tax=Streptomyces gilvosporeus TaxID=553510 RepID=A0A1V0U192_9ACTN|nr:ATP-grasp domain-containing protein [Streptomyces gilvosporeus]ARF58798.1 hypothetical protein B1H19_35595 [Streptomyces gilvosporeus]
MKPHVAIIDRVGYGKYRLPDGSPVLDPAVYDVTLITEAKLVGQPQQGECTRVFGFGIDDEEETRGVLRHLHAAHALQYLVCFPENLQIPVAASREELGISGATAAEMLPFRDKDAMKETARNSGIPVAEWRPIERNADARPLLDKHGKIVLKPRDGAGSAGIFVIDDEADLLALDADLRGYQAEQFIDAPMIHIDAVVADGKAVVAPTSRYLSTTLSHTTRQPLASVVIDEPVLLQRSRDFLERVIETFRVEDAVLHLEAFVTPEDIIFNEMARRAGGGGIVTLTQALTGFNLFESMVRMEVGLPLERSHPTVGAPGGGFVLFYAEAGTLESIDDSSIPDDWIVERKLSVPVGGFYQPVGRAGGSIVSYVFSASSEKQAIERAEAIQASVTLTVREGQE